ncbi:MarR-family transcriptional regulator [Colletotrichum kahawae]|uniref:MarR-family transcriptional regulator n=1 Tax=Colletotrichum kahawae TaxID=34407 RepID=A0AAD9YLA7_COLKA|nr:MarR-family transcriptional regulator [Colletotrichum kahawae]
MKSESEPVNGSAQNGVTIRNHRPGDMGFITYRHGTIYANEFGYGSPFEALVGRITSDFITTFDPSAERCWIAERDGQFLGCIIFMKDRETSGRAKLRCFLVEKSARGLGLGTQLMKLCIDFAREVGYKRVRLRTDSNMVGARRMYTKTGFKILGTEEHRTWGEHIQSTGENWEMEL